MTSKAIRELARKTSYARTRFAYSFLGLALFSLLSVHVLSVQTQAAVKINAPSMATVIVETSRETVNIQRVITPAKVEAKIQSMVSADIEGNVVSIKKPLGSRVKAGDVVMYIKNQDPGFTYAPVPVRSPITGVIAQFQTSLMQRVSKGDRLFSVIDPKSVKLVAEIASSDLPLVRIGSQGFFTTDLSSDMVGSFIRLSGVSPTIDPRTGTASAEMDFVLSKKNPLPAIGSVGHSIFEINRGKALFIPESALVFQEGKPFVRVLNKNNQAMKRPIELGEQKESLYAITKGLGIGERIVLRSTRPVKDGEIVYVEGSDKAEGSDTNSQESN